MMEKLQNQKWLKIGLLTTAGLLLVGGLVWVGIQIGKQQAIRDTQYAIRISPAPEPTATLISTFPPEATLSPLPSEAPAKEGDETTGWKSYMNTKYGYSIKYPPETKVQEGLGYEERIQETTFTLFGPKAPPGPSSFTDGFGITLAVIKNPNNETPIQFAQEYYKQAEEDINSKILEGDISRCKVESVTRSGTNGARFTYCSKAPGSGILNFSEWYVKNGVTFQIYAVLQNEDYLATFDLMLSTFRFLE